MEYMKLREFSYLQVPLSWAQGVGRSNLTAPTNGIKLIRASHSMVRDHRRDPEEVAGTERISNVESRLAHLQLRQGALPHNRRRKPHLRTPMQLLGNRRIKRFSNRPQ